MKKIKITKCDDCPHAKVYEKINVCTLIRKFTSKGKVHPKCPLIKNK